MKRYPSFAALCAVVALLGGVGLAARWNAAVPEDPRGALMRYVRPVTNAVRAVELQTWAMSVLREHGEDLRSGEDQTPRISAIPEVIRRIPTLGFAPAQVHLARAGKESAG
jgi:hypothetical protein